MFLFAARTLECYPVECMMGFRRLVLCNACFLVLLLRRSFTLRTITWWMLLERQTSTMFCLLASKTTSPSSLTLEKCMTNMALLDLDRPTFRVVNGTQQQKQGTHVLDPMWKNMCAGSVTLGLKTAMMLARFLFLFLLLPSVSPGVNSEIFFRRTDCCFLDCEQICGTKMCSCKWWDRFKHRLF